MSCSSESTCCVSHPQDGCVNCGVSNSYNTTLNGENSNFSIQSAETDPLLEAEQLIEKEVVTFDSNPDNEVSTINYAAIYDDVTSDLYTKDFELGDFLSRPTRLYHYVVTPGAPFATVTEQIWTDFLGNARIKKKLDNYSYIQCKIKIKIVVNSTPFVYGMLGVSYAPLPNFTPISDFSTNKILTSQRPTVWIDLAKSQGGEMELPFFYYKNWLQLELAATTDGMGELKIWQVVQAAVANSGITSTPSITIYAWAENVRLYGNTVNLAIQSSESGPISGVASTVANVASYFSDIPFIGRFAKATTIGASAVASIASMFGYSNIPVISNAAPMKSAPFHGMASSHISNVIDKLTIDPQNELSISPTTVGLPPVDELAIANLTSRMAIIATPNWATTDATNTLLFAANVVPTLCELDTATANQIILIETPVSMVSRLFEHWRGDLIYNVKIIKSPYHRGRLVINYDPSGNIITTADNNNVVQTVIIDINESDEFNIRVPFMAPQSFLIVPDTLQTDFAINGGAITTYNEDFHNGRLTIRVLNNLTAPLDTAAIKLVISICGAENFELANPSDIRFTNGSGIYPSPFVIQSSEIVATPKTTTQSQVIEYVMGRSRPTPQNVYDVNFGERIASVREILRRTVKVGTERCGSNTAGTSLDLYMFTHTKYPQSFGFDSNGIHGAIEINGINLDRNFNFVNTGPFQWLQGCFVGMRGSTMWHYCGLDQTNIPTMRVRRLSTNVVNGTAVTTRSGLRNITTNIIASSFSSSARGGTTRATSGYGGISLIHQATQTGLSVLYPQYNKFRFVTTNPANSTYGSVVDDTLNEKFSLDIITSNKNGAFSGYERYFSIGPDFTFFYYLNAPPRYCYTFPTAAVF
jgi:hypothetical protein